MLFNIDDIWEKPDLGKLRPVDISTAPAGRDTSKNHFITFKNQTDQNPEWCSEPVQGRSISFQEGANSDNSPIRPVQASELENLIESRFQTLLESDDHDQRSDSPDDHIKVTPESLTIIGDCPNRSLGLMTYLGK